MAFLKLLFYGAVDGVYNVKGKDEKIESHYYAAYVEELEAKVVSSHGVWNIVCKQKHRADE